MEGQGQGEGNASGVPTTLTGGYVSGTPLASQQLVPSTQSGGYADGTPVGAPQLVPVPPLGHRPGRGAPRGAPRVRPSRLSRTSSLEAGADSGLRSGAPIPPPPSPASSLNPLTPALNPSLNFSLNSSLNPSLNPSLASSTSPFNHTQATSAARASGPPSPLQRASSASDYQLRAMGMPGGAPGTPEGAIAWGEHEEEGEEPSSPSRLPSASATEHQQRALGTPEAARGTPEGGQGQGNSFSPSRLRSASATEHQLRALGIPEGEPIQHSGTRGLPRYSLGRASSAADSQLRAAGILEGGRGYAAGVPEGRGNAAGAPEGGGYAAALPGGRGHAAGGLSWGGGRGAGEGFPPQQRRSPLGRASSATEQQLRALGAPGQGEAEGMAMLQQHYQQQQHQQQQQQQQQRLSPLGRASSAKEHQLRAIGIPGQGEAEGMAMPQQQHHEQQYQQPQHHQQQHHHHQQHNQQPHQQHQHQQQQQQQQPRRSPLGRASSAREHQLRAFGIPEEGGAPAQGDRGAPFPFLGIPQMGGAPPGRRGQAGGVPEGWGGAGRIGRAESLNVDPFEGRYTGGVPQGWSGVDRPGGGGGAGGGGGGGRIGRAASLNVDRAWKPGADGAGMAAGTGTGGGEGGAYAPRGIGGGSPSRNLPPLPIQGWGHAVGVGPSPQLRIPRSPSMGREASAVLQVAVPGPTASEFRPSMGRDAGAPFQAGGSGPTGGSESRPPKFEQRPKFEPRPSAAAGKGDYSPRGAEGGVRLGDTSSLEDPFAALEKDLLPVLPPIANGTGQRGSSSSTRGGSVVPRRVKSADNGLIMTSSSNRNGNGNGTKGVATTSESERRSLSSARDCASFDAAEHCTVLENTSECTLVDFPPGVASPGRGDLLPWLSPGVPQAGQPLPFTAGISVPNSSGNSTSHDSNNSNWNGNSTIDSDSNSTNNTSTNTNGSYGNGNNDNNDTSTSTSSYSTGAANSAQGGVPAAYRPPVRPYRPAGGPMGLRAGAGGIQRTSSEIVPCRALHAWPSGADIDHSPAHERGPSKEATSMCTPGAPGAFYGGHSSSSGGSGLAHEVQYSTGDPSDQGYTAGSGCDTSGRCANSGTSVDRTQDSTVVATQGSTDVGTGGGSPAGGYPGRREPAGQQIRGVPGGLRRAARAGGAAQEQLRPAGIARTSSALLPVSWKVNHLVEDEGDFLFPSIRVPPRAFGTPGAGGGGGGGGGGGRRAVGVADLRKQAALRLAAAGAPNIGGEHSGGLPGSPGAPAVYQGGSGMGSCLGEGLGEGAYGAPVASPMVSLGPAPHFIRSDLTPLKGARGAEALGGMGMGTVRGARGGVPYSRAGQGHQRWGGKAGKGGGPFGGEGGPSDSSDAGDSSPNNSSSSYLQFVSPRVTLGCGGYGRYTARGGGDGDQFLAGARALLMRSAVGGGSGDISGMLMSGERWSREGEALDEVSGSPDLSSDVSSRGSRAAAPGVHLLMPARTPEETEAGMEGAVPLPLPDQGQGQTRGGAPGAEAGVGLGSEAEVGAPPGQEAGATIPGPRHTQQQAAAYPAAHLAAQPAAHPAANPTVHPVAYPVAYPAAHPGADRLAEWPAAHTAEQGPAASRDRHPSGPGIPPRRCGEGLLEEGRGGGGSREMRSVPDMTPEKSPGRERSGSMGKESGGGGGALAQRGGQPAELAGSPRGLVDASSDCQRLQRSTAQGVDSSGGKGSSRHLRGGARELQEVEGDRVYHSQQNLSAPLYPAAPASGHTPHTPPSPGSVVLLNDDGTVLFINEQYSGNSVLRMHPGSRAASNPHIVTEGTPSGRSAMSMPEAHARYTRVKGVAPAAEEGLAALGKGGGEWGRGDGGGWQEEGQKKRVEGREEGREGQGEAGRGEHESVKRGGSGPVAFTGTEPGSGSGSVSGSASRPLAASKPLAVSGSVLKPLAVSGSVLKPLAVSGSGSGSLSGPLAGPGQRVRPLAGSGSGSGPLAGTGSGPLAGPGQRVRRRAALRDHVLGVAYEDICAAFVVASKEIGSGQFGHIRKCVERATGHQYACKTVYKLSIRGQKDAEDLRHEVHCLKKLRGHKSVITLKHAAEDEKSVHLVMDLCRGGDLFDRIKKQGPIPEKCAAKIVRALTEALLACHSRGIIHRDIKPENVLLTDKDPDCHSVKLIDFGIAAPFRPGAICDEVMGTPFYMAPEVYRRRYGPECDFWSLGVVLFLMVSGVPPFWPKKGHDVAHDVLHGRLKFNHPKWGEISGACIDLTRRMLDKDPINRITGAEILGHEWIRAHAI